MLGLVTVRQESIDFSARARVDKVLSRVYIGRVKNFKRQNDLRQNNFLEHHMPSTTCQAFLLIADISGYTQFMKLHRMSVNHAKQVTVELLKALISATRSPLKLAELEGDAAFFYAVCPEDAAKLTTVLASLKTQVLEMFRAFYRAKDKLNALRLCMCDACLGVNDLRLKIVVHAGEVAIERIQSFEKLFGLDVIVVHRLLKSGLDMSDYVLITEPVARAFGDFYELPMEQHQLDCEGIGQITTAIYYPPATLIQAPQEFATASRVSLFQKLRYTFKLDSRFVRDLLRFSKRAPDLRFSQSLLQKFF